MRKAGRGLPEKHYIARAVFFGTVESDGISRLVSKGGRGVRHLPAKTVGGLPHWGPLSFPEVDSNLSLASPLRRVQGQYGRRIRQDRSRLPFPKHYGESQGAPDWST